MARQWFSVVVIAAATGLSTWVGLSDAACPQTEVQNNVLCPGQFSMCSWQNAQNNGNNWLTTCQIMTVPAPPPALPPADDPVTGPFGCQSAGANLTECVGSATPALCNRKVYCMVTTQNNQQVCRTDPAKPSVSQPAAAKATQNCAPAG